MPIGPGGPPLLCRNLLPRREGGVHSISDDVVRDCLPGPPKRTGLKTIPIELDVRRVMRDFSASMLALPRLLNGVGEACIPRAINMVGSQKNRIQCRLLDGDLHLALKEAWGIADGEHLNSWLRFGCEDGRMYVLDIYKSGTVVFSLWADGDFKKELARERGRTNISFENTL